jgi:hypothetical protein
LQLLPGETADDLLFQIREFSLFRGDHVLDVGRSESIEILVADVSRRIPVREFCPDQLFQRRTDQFPSEQLRIWLCLVANLAIGGAMVAIGHERLPGRKPEL